MAVPECVPQLSCLATAGDTASVRLTLGPWPLLESPGMFVVPPWAAGAASMTIEVAARISVRDFI
jgi:hypothetical protein